MIRETIHIESVPDSEPHPWRTNMAGLDLIYACPYCGAAYERLEVKPGDTLPTKCSTCGADIAPVTVK